MQEPTFRLFQPMHKEQLHTKGIYEKIYDNMKWPSKESTKKKWSPSFMIEIFPLTRMLPPRNANIEWPCCRNSWFLHLSGGSQFRVFRFSQTGLSQTFLKRLGGRVDEKKPDELKPLVWDWTWHMTYVWYLLAIIYTIILLLNNSANIVHVYTARVSINIWKTLPAGSS